MKKFLSIFALMLVIAPLSGSVAPQIQPAAPAVVKTRASLITPEVLAEIAAPVSPSVKSSEKLSIKNVKTISDVRSWVYQNCPAIKIATIPGKASFYLPQNSAIAVGSETEAKYMSFVIAHEISHHYQWIVNDGDLTRWNTGMRSQEGAPPVLEVQADYMAFETLGSHPAIANYAKAPANQLESEKALSVLSLGKSAGC